MRNYWAFILVMVGCQSEMIPEQVFQAAKEKFYEADEVSFSHEMLCEIPYLGEVDTVMHELIIQKHRNRHFDYNYLVKRKISEIAYLDDVLLLISHRDSTITYYSEEDDRNFVDIASSNGFIDFSPVNLLKKEPWTFKQDTAINQKTYLNFFRVDMDTTIDDKKIYLENHLFINPANLLAERYSRRLYHNGKRSQFIESKFFDYKFGPISEQLEASAPQSYVSVLSGEKNREPSKLLAVGGLAPDFELQDLQGNNVRLSSFKGRKVLLDFSMINCGWCKIALEKFNKPDFAFADNVVPLYVNPVDSKEKMEKYSSRVDIPFSVLIDDKTVGEAYGVSGYPTFYLIDENGKIEEVFEGFDVELIEKIRKGA